MAKQQSTGFSLKDHLFNADRVRFLARQFARNDSRFQHSEFFRAVMRQLGELDLKQRIVHIAVTLERYLAADFPTAAKQIRGALPPELDPCKTDDDFGDFIIAPLGEYVVRRGMDPQNISVSLSLLKEITKRFSMEDAMRAFINAHPRITLRELKEWSRDRNYHVRRLVSECTRPRLPWSCKLTIDYSVPLPFLDALHADSTRYVTRSVANHLNDIAKRDPELVLKTLQKWRVNGGQRSEELDWICRHALRTLVKQGHPGTMKFLGMRTNARVTVSPIELRRSSISAGEPLEFSVTITAQRTESLIVDYVIEFVKANGRLAPKVFKGKKLQLRRGESTQIVKRHPLRANATTYKLFPGTHHLIVQVNGVPAARASFKIR